MESPKFTKQECTRLSISSAALAVGTYWGVMGTTGVGLPLAVVGTILASVGGGFVTNEVSAISNRLGKDTVGKAIAAVIVAVAKSEQFPKATADLRKMAKLAEDKWENLVENLPGEFAPIQASQLTEFFANRPEDFSNLTALDIGLWVALLNDLRWKAGVILAQPVITYTANCLYENFPKALREVLKEDFQSDGKAFAGMVLDLFGVMRSQIGKNHNLILERLDEIKLQNPSAIPADFNLDEFEQRLELLSQKSQDEIAAELRSVAGQIDSGFQEVLQQMGVLQTGICELLENNNTILDLLKDLSKRSQQQHKKLVKLIKNNDPPEIVQAKYWQFLVQKKDESRPNWLQFLTEYDAAMIGVNKGSYFEPPLPLENPPTIPANESLFLTINLEYPNYQLLLFNRSKQGINLYCPSFGYAMNPIIESPQILLPQKDSWAEKTGQKFLFKQTGKEEFLAIVFEKHLNLHWLSPKREEALPELNAERIQELYEQLRQEDTWHVFYKSFQVV